MMKKILFALLCVLGFTIQSFAEDLDAQYATNLLKVGTQAPNFTLPTIDGKTFSLNSLKGKYVVIDFWASWCPDCRKISPEVKAIAQQYQQKNVVVVGVSFDTKKDAWQQYVNKEETPTNQIHVSNLQKMKDAQVAKDYGVHWIPSLYLLDPQGRVMLATVEIEKIKTALKQLNL